MLDDLIDVAESRAHRVHWHKGGPLAAWLPHCEAIPLQHSAPEMELLCLLAHKLAHAEHD